MNSKRGSGILLHITSLPGPYGIGDLGRGAYEFIDFLEGSSQSCWQFLPVGPANTFDNSPYMSLSAFAGNPLFISPELLVEAGFLDKAVVAAPPAFSEYVVEFSRVIPFKFDLLEQAYANFRQGRGEADGFDAFCRQENWLDDFALFRALREEYENKPWFGWPHDIAARKPAALEKCRKKLADRILFHKFVQFCFAEQWERMWRYAGGKGIALIGDIPIYLGLDSADVWAFQDCFKLDRQTLLPTHVAGVPPDYFSKTGQRWGNPLFRWHGGSKEVRDRLFSWWRERFRHTFRTVDVVRIDHFRGFEAYWEIPAEEKTAVHGKWVKGPGKAFFDEMAKEIGELPIIAEDLGLITPEVEELRDGCGFPGMKILQFAFDSDEHNAYLPHNYETPNCVVYTGTHDNDTTVGWYLSDAVAASSKERAMRYANSHEGMPVHWDFIRMAFASTARLAIVPMQDVLGFGSDCRMNLPSTNKDNWRWRLAPRFLTDALRARLRDETVFYGRARQGETADTAGGDDA